MVAAVYVRRSLSERNGVQPCQNARVEKPERRHVSGKWRTKARTPLHQKKAGNAAVVAVFVSLRGNALSTAGKQVANKDDDLTSADASPL